MISKPAGIRARRAAACLATALALALSMVPASAWAYYHRGSVSVALGTTELQVQAGGAASTTVSVSPASDEQTEGCGMPKCPQGCSDSCADENGQCRCAGSDYATYRPSAAASSSDASVAVAVCEGGALTVYGKSEGTATITVRGSLRQFTDAEASLVVTVSGEAANKAPVPAAAEMPEEATGEQQDKADVVEKTVMGRPVRNVRIGEACDVAGNLAAMAGIDGDVTFWQGDTYYHPNYSLTFNGSDYDAAAADACADLDVRLDVRTEPAGALTQPLDGMDGFVSVDFAHRGALPGPVTVYALADTVFPSDDTPVALFSYDEEAKAFVREDADAAVVGGYASFTVGEGKIYVVSSRDLTSEAASAVTGGAGPAQGAGSCCDDPAADDGSQGVVEGPGTGALPPIAVAAAVAAVAAVLGAAGTLLVLRRRAGSKGGRSDADEGVAGTAGVRNDEGAGEVDGARNDEGKEERA